MCESGDTIIFLCSARERKKCIHTIKFFASFKSKSMLLLDVRACVRAVYDCVLIYGWQSILNFAVSEFIYRTQTKFHTVFPMPIRAHARNNNNAHQLIFLTFIFFFANYINKNLVRNLYAQQTF